MKAIKPPELRLSDPKDNRFKVEEKPADLPTPPKWLRKQKQKKQRYLSEHHIFLELTTAVSKSKALSAIVSQSDVEMFSTLSVQIAQYRRLHSKYIDTMTLDQEIRYTRAINGLIKEIRLGLQKLALSPEDRRKLFVVEDKPQHDLRSVVMGALEANDGSDDT